VKHGLVAFASGLLFAFGLCLAGMTHPSRVLGFLDVLGTWDPSLALVMVGAVSVAAIAFRVAAKRPASVFGGAFRTPDPRARVDRSLVTGAALFGVGWGLSGLCPGPALVSLTSGQVGAVVFVAAMIAGVLLRAYCAGRASLTRGKPAFVQPRVPPERL
jgi:uncharacterized membrane protein YedE/YeeE